MLYADKSVWSRAGELILKATEGNEHLTLEEMRELRLASASVSANCSNGISDMTLEETEH